LYELKGEMHKWKIQNNRTKDYYGTFAATSGPVLKTREAPGG
jgi:hypothetical protein